jgi:hypothetical protein
MSKEEDRKKGFWPGVIFISFVAALITFFVMLQVEKNTLSDYEKVAVWCANQEIPKGKEITGADLENAFVLVEMDKKNVPDKSITNPEALIGQQTIVEITQGSPLTGAMFEDVNQHMAKLYHPVLAGCKAEDLFQMVSGVLRKGDMVHVYVVNEEMEQTYLLWEDVVVYQVFDSAGNVITAEDISTPAARINLLLEKGRAEQFYNELQNGSLRFVKVCEE